MPVAVVTALIAGAIAPYESKVAFAAPGDSSADLVFGQANGFSTGTCNLGGPVTASTLCQVTGIAVDAAGNIWVSDWANNRVLEFDSPTTTDTVADHVIGQPNMTSNACLTPPTASSLCNPADLKVDSAGNLWVADLGDQRVLEFNSPLTTDTVADRVFGQPGFTTRVPNNGGISASSLAQPDGIAVDSAGNLYVGDEVNHRILEYNTPLSSDTVADRVIGQGGSFTTGACGAVSATTWCGGGRFAMDAADNLYAAESTRNRVLRYANPVTTDTTADQVFGQGGSFVTSISTVTASGLSTPTGVGISTNGGILITDEFNNRVLEFHDPLTTDTVADRVFGTGDSFTVAGSGAASQTTVNHPTGVVTDANGNVFIAERNNHRMTEYDDAIAFTVNSNGDGADLSPADGVCDAGGGVCTLRAAIQQANATVGFDDIRFAIGSGPVSIAPGSALPAITDRVRINATTQPGFAGAPLVELNGTGAGVVASGLVASAGSSLSEIRGLIINRFAGGNGIQIGADFVFVAGNYIGTDAGGTGASGNGTGVDVSGNLNSVGSTIATDRNIISGNLADGVAIHGGATGNTVAGNYVGTNATGTAAIANVANGVGLFSSGNTVGGTAPGAGNVISGNASAGITTDTGSTIVGNYIGTNAAGIVAIPNVNYGVFISGNSNVVGTAGAGNLISGNNTGVFLSSVPAFSNQIVANFIGTRAFGLGAVPNVTGIRLYMGATGNTIGGNAAGMRNVISGNTGEGIFIDGTGGNTIKGNVVGLSDTGLPDGNGLDGVLQINGSGTNVIGGTGAGDGNIISRNAGFGVHIDGGANVSTIRGNAIYANAGGGISLTTGGNAGLAAPIISAAAATVTGTSAGCPACTIDVYSDDTSQGRVYQGSATASGGTWTFTGSIAGPNVTATVTDGSGNTSPFSSPVAVNLFREAGSPGNAGFAGDGGVANAAPVRLNGPHGMVKFTGNLYFADTNNNRIRTITPNAPAGTLATVAGSSLTPGFGGDGGAATSALLNLPNDVVVAANGDFYIADTGNCRIRKVSGGTISTVAGNGACGYSGEGTATSVQLNHPYGVSLDAAGNLLIADTDNCRIRKVIAGTISTVAGTGVCGYGGDGGAAAAALLNRPYKVGIPGDPCTPSDFYVIADRNNNRVRKVAVGTGTITTLAGTGVAAYNGDGGVAVAATLNAPEYVAMNPNCDVYIADTNNNLIRHVSKATGLILTAAGTGFTGTSDPDAINALLAHLDHPAGVAVGSLTIADTGNQIIRVVPTSNDPTGQPPAPRPGSGNFCSEGTHSMPLAHAADWSVILGTLAMVAGRRKMRWFFQWLSSRLRLKGQWAQT